MGEEKKIYPPITVVDDSDTVIGYMGLFEAIEKNLRRRIAYTAVCDEEGKFLIQRRSANVLSPNLLDFAASGHVNQGQTYLDASKAELEEELGLKGYEFVEVTAPFSTPGFYNGVYKVVVPSGTVPLLNPQEVASIFWVSRDELFEMLDWHPQQFTEPFLAVWQHVYDKIFS